MHRMPDDRPAQSLRSRRTQPMLPGVTQPTLPMVTRTPPEVSLKKAPPRAARRAFWQLTLPGLMLALLYLALYPLLANALPAHDQAKRAFASLFPWLPRLYWTNWAPLAQGISHLAPFQVGSAAGSANVLLFLLALAFGLVLLAARAGRKAGAARQSETRLLFWCVMAFAALFAALFVLAPALASQDVFLYGLYGRVKLVLHSNPYLPPPALPSNDLLHGVLSGALPPAFYGPLWLDATQLVAFLARESIAHLLLAYRLLGLSAHLVNAALIWHILGKYRSEARVAGTLLYAWNPAVLLMGVADMHYELVALSFVLLAALFYQRRALLLSWISLLVAILLNVFCLLLAPLFLRILWKESRVLRPGGRAFMWLLAALFSAAIVALAYFPYWNGWGLAGLLGQLRRVFLPDTVANSIDAALLNIHIGSLASIHWLTSPLFWDILALAIAAIFLLLGSWLVENLELALLLASWVYLAQFALTPLTWPWSILFPLALALCSGNARTMLLALLLSGGALLGYYFLLWPQPWQGMALVTIGLPLLIWGWALFFTSTWQMTRAGNTSSGPVVAVRPRGPRFSRPTWPGRR